MEEETYREFLKSIPFGKKYLVPREQLMGKVPVISSREIESQQVKSRWELTMAEDGHKYLQNLVKQTAEGKGFRAVTEHPTPDGLGRVDVSLELDGTTIACEVSVTSTIEQELSNIEKCLRAGYDKVILCSLEGKTLEGARELAFQKLSKTEREKVLFLKPEEISAYLGQFVRQTAKRKAKAEAEEGLPLSVKSAELWQDKIWHALRHLDDPSILNKSSLSRLVYIERLAEEEFRNYSVKRGMALKKALTGCIDKIVTNGKDKVGLRKICQFVELIKGGQTLTDISKALGVSRERVSTSYKRKAVELVTQDFLDLVKTCKNK